VSSIVKQKIEVRSKWAFAVCATLFMVAALLLTAVAPVAMSIGIVFLFAGPHNYVEARYFLTRLPARMGRLKTFFVVSGVGVVSLTIAFPLLTRLSGWMQWPPQSVVWLVGLWNTSLILWCSSLVWLRSVQPPKRNWDYALPVGLALAGVAWVQPIMLPLLLVFLHPLMGLWVLDREIAKSRPCWQAVYRRCVSCVPLLLLILWTTGLDTKADFVLFDISPTASDQVSHHAGAGVLTMINPTKLIATHAFLELLHYGVWLVAVPAASGRVFSDGFRSIPLMKRGGTFRKMISALLLVSVGVVALLWTCFAVDYSTTRDVYFTVAMLHVLAEVPFLLRLL
jgi:hypothetical protein